MNPLRSTLGYHSDKMSTMSLPSDVQRFLTRYNDQEDHPEAEDNLKFYSNSIPCRPDELLIEEVLEK